MTFIGLTLEQWANWVAIVGFPLVALQLLLSERARVAHELIDLKSTILEALAAIEIATTDSERRLRVVGLVSLLESLAALLNDRIISLWARKFWRPYLGGVLEAVCAVPAYSNWIRAEITDELVYCELRKFRKNNIKLFKQDQLVYCALSCKECDRGEE